MPAPRLQSPLLANAANLCPHTDKPLYSVGSVRQAVFDELSPRCKAFATVGGTFNRCSFGASRLTMANSLVAPLVELPCNGTTA